MTGIKPQLIYRQTGPCCRAVEIWKTTCIVTNFGKNSPAACSILINPSNPELTGISQFPYFPRGGPVPKLSVPRSTSTQHHSMHHASTWGGMEAGNGMLYPVSVVDGLVHLHGGWKLQAECKWKRTVSNDGEACPVGSAVETSAGEDRLSRDFSRVIHTTPPFYKFEKTPVQMLSKCYESALQKAFYCPAGARVATPLLGAGARGFPAEVAMEVAAQTSWKWCRDDTSSENNRGEEDVLVFGLLESEIAEQLAEMFQGQQ
jgi:O-acetyl-ADP-ribose deacetylase (regulator of RNase III)